MTRRQFAYLMSCNVVFFLVIAVGGYSYTNWVDQRRAADERAAQVARAAQGEVLLKAFCEVIHQQIEVFRDPTSPTGQKAFDAWSAMSVQFHCPPG